MSRSAALLLCLLGCHVWKAVTKTLREPGAGPRCYDFTFLHGQLKLHYASVPHWLYHSSVDGDLGWFHFLNVMWQ
ncbi:hypothetical protein STEG23_037674 [Scotinomys teguina]